MDPKVAIITGGNSGVGWAVARRLAKDGVRIVLADVEDARPRAQSIADELGGEALAVSTDVADETQVERLFDRCWSAYGRLDYLINSAGVDRVNTVADATIDEWDWIVGVNLRGVFLCCRAAIPLMKRSGGGAIVNIGSTFAFTGNPKSAIYSATKGGVHQLTKCMAVDHTAEGIRVNCVAPGPVDTPMLQKEVSEHSDPEEMKAGMLRGLPINRVATPEEIANVVCFVLSDQASYMTGSIVVADGGECL